MDKIECLEPQAFIDTPELHKNLQETFSNKNRENKAEILKSKEELNLQISENLATKLEIQSNIHFESINKLAELNEQTLLPRHTNLTNLKSRANRVTMRRIQSNIDPNQRNSFIYSFSSSISSLHSLKIRQVSKHQGCFVTSKSNEHIRLRAM